MSKCIHDGIFLLLWARYFLSIAGSNIIIFTFIKTCLCFDLTNISGMYFKTIFTQYMILNFFICSTP